MMRPVQPLPCTCGQAPAVIMSSARPVCRWRVACVPGKRWPSGQSGCARSGADSSTYDGAIRLWNERTQ